MSLLPHPSTKMESQTKLWPIRSSPVHSLGSGGGGRGGGGSSVAAAAAALAAAASLVMDLVIRPFRRPWLLAVFRPRGVACSLSSVSSAVPSVLSFSLVFSLETVAKEHFVWFKSIHTPKRLKLWEFFKQKLNKPSPPKNSQLPGITTWASHQHKLNLPAYMPALLPCFLLPWAPTACCRQNQHPHHHPVYRPDRACSSLPHSSLPVSEPSISLTFLPPPVFLSPLCMSRAPAAQPQPFTPAPHLSVHPKLLTEPHSRERAVAGNHFSNANPTYSQTEPHCSLSEVHIELSLRLYISTPTSSYFSPEASDVPV